LKIVTPRVSSIPDALQCPKRVDGPVSTRGYTTGGSPPPWKRLIRFQPSSSSNEWVYGEPITLEKDGSLPEDVGKIQAKVVEPGLGGEVFGPGCRVTDNVVGVKKVLSKIFD
jgi:hypothetical protein